MPLLNPPFAVRPQLGAPASLAYRSISFACSILTYPYLIGRDIYHSEAELAVQDVQTRESDDEGEEAHDSGATGHGASHGQKESRVESGSESDDDELENGMLLRDLPKRTTFYDPVAERQMSQTDAKLFYHRNKADMRSATGAVGGQSIPQSPFLASGSRPATEYGADSLILDASGRREGNAPGMEMPTSVIDPSSSSQAHTGADIHTAGHYSGQHYNTVSYNNQGGTVGEGSGPTLSVGGLFDTEPHITTELSAISKDIQRILDLRRKYIGLSLQGPDDNPKDDPDFDIYPPPPEPAWAQAAARRADARDHAHDPEKSDHEAHEGKRHHRKRKPGQDIGEDFDMEDLLPLPGDDGRSFKLDDSGVYQLFDDNNALEPAVRVPTIREFYMDLDDILNVSSDGPTKSFAFRRLQYLEGKFNLYVLLNEYQETADSKKVPHRDFYNVRKVDTHVHHSACMNQKHLLRFIKSKMKKFPNEVVLYRDGKHLTLAEVFASIKLTAYDLSIDTLDMHVSLESMSY